MATKQESEKVTLDGHVFDSIIESRYYTQLKWAQEHKTILFFRLQPRYLLQEEFEKNDKKFRKIDYLADFEVHHCDGSIETIDIKSTETEAFKIKRKLFEKKYPHKLSLITYSKEWGGWFDLEKLKKMRKEADKHAKQIEAKAKATKGHRKTKKGQA
jgi:hypothetical protein